VVHHGGAGTLAAGIRAGRPTIVCATQGDQPFHGSIAQAQGVGLYLGMVGSPKLTPEKVAAGITEAATDPAISAAAEAMGEQVRAEDGVATAISFIDKVPSAMRYPWPTTG
jgi:sterol 3beta-glucosyltransferase